MGWVLRRKQFDNIAPMAWQHLWTFLKEKWGDIVYFILMIHFLCFSSVLKAKRSHAERKLKENSPQTSENIRNGLLGRWLRQSTQPMWLATPTERYFERGVRAGARGKRNRKPSVGWTKNTLEDLSCPWNSFIDSHSWICLFSPSVISQYLQPFSRTAFQWQTPPACLSEGPTGERSQNGCLHIGFLAKAHAHSAWRGLAMSIPSGAPWLVG